MRHRGSGKPPSVFALHTVYAILLGCWASGALWLLVHFELPHRGEFGLTLSPLEPWFLAAHGAFAFAALGLGGWLLATHVPPGWRSGRSRPSGIAMASGTAVLIVTGYLLYYLGGDRSRALVSIAHWAVGLTMPFVLGGHLWQRHRSRLQVRLFSTSTPRRNPFPEARDPPPSRVARQSASPVRDVVDP